MFHQYQINICIVQWQLEASEPEWVNPSGIWYGVNSLRPWRPPITVFTYLRIFLKVSWCDSDLNFLLFLFFDFQLFVFRSSVSVSQFNFFLFLRFISCFLYLFSFIMISIFRKLFYNAVSFLFLKYYLKHYLIWP